MDFIESYYNIVPEFFSHRQIAVIADFHDRNCESIISCLRIAKPDIILIAGDLLSTKKIYNSEYSYDPEHSFISDCPNADRFVHVAPSIAPTFFTSGNHEWCVTEADMERMKSAGIMVLENAWTKYKGLIIGGMASPDLSNYLEFEAYWRKEHPSDRRGNIRSSFFYWKTHDERKTPDFSWLPEFERQAGFKILMCHHPEYWTLREPKLFFHPIDLVLAGHAHGGQIRFGNRGVYAPGQGLFPRYVGGVYQGVYGKMIVSRGLSNTSRIPRIGNPPELVFVKF